MDNFQTVHYERLAFMHFYFIKFGYEIKLNPLRTNTFDYFSSF